MVKCLVGHLEQRENPQMEQVSSHFGENSTQILQHNYILPSSVITQGTVNWKTSQGIMPIGHLETRWEINMREQNQEGLCEWNACIHLQSKTPGQILHTRYTDERDDCDRRQSSKLSAKQCPVTKHLLEALVNNTLPQSDKGRKVNETRIFLAARAKQAWCENFN